MMKILLVEDNQSLAGDIREILSEQKYLTEWVTTLTAASEKINAYQYNLAIVDIGLPDGSGLDLVREIRDNHIECGVLILTARNSIADKVTGLGSGADDYITKPFHKAELVARVQAILRRFSPGKSNILHFSEIEADLAATTVTISGNSLCLTRKEFDLLVYFLYNPNRLLTKENIAEHLWGDHIDQADSFDFVYNHIKNLRKKITRAGGKDYIRARYGMGYVFTNQKVDQ